MSKEKGGFLSKYCKCGREKEKRIDSRCDTCKGGVSYGDVKD